MGCTAKFTKKMNVLNHTVSSKVFISFKTLGKMHKLLFLGGYKNQNRET